MQTYLFTVHTGQVTDPAGHAQAVSTLMMAAGSVAVSVLIGGVAIWLAGKYMLGASLPAVLVAAAIGAAAFTWWGRYVFSAPASQ